MNKSSAKGMEGYFALSQSWAGSRSEELQRSRRVAWIVALGALSVALLLGLALVLAMPLKRVETHTLMVDRQTGHVQHLTQFDAEAVTADTALTQSFLAQYVVARERFDIATIRDDYRKVALWSAGPARQEYLAMMPATNAESPLARYPRSTLVDVTVKSLTSVSENRVLVRFDSIQRDPGSGISSVRPQVALIDFSYSQRPMSLEDRLINPLGFQVTRYRRSMEALPVIRDDPPDGRRTPLTRRAVSEPLPTAGPS
ncbi:MAG: type IV secretion system protein [Chloroflexota bacterium]|nr:type IV secretion system protein [Chloroflexota bacterium]